MSAESFAAKKEKTKADEEQIKIKALVDNTAQSIFNYLKEIENKREIYEERWIWELLQNALDVSRQDRKVDVTISKHGDQLVFKHNGRPFRPEEVAHLIYHGSTKRESDLGKFGTGFLVTHLLSRSISIRGIREDNKKFFFLLNRNGSSADDIERLMEDTWDEYRRSLEAISGEPDYTAEYEYTLGDVTLRTAREGIETLIKIAPYVLAFNEKLGAITVSNDERTQKLELVKVTKNAPCVIKTVKEEQEGNEPVFHKLWLVGDSDLQTTVRLQTQKDGKLNIERLEGIPKLFLGFPLFGTQDLPYPMPVNSKGFEPTEKRDGIFLGKESTDDVECNKRLLERANGLVIQLIAESQTENWDNIHSLLNLGPPPEKDWLDAEWYEGLLRNLINRIMDLDLVVTHNGTCISFRQALFPIIEEDETDKIDELWDLLYRFSLYQATMPAKRLAIEWANILKKWKSLGIDVAEREITLEKLAQEMESAGDISNVKNKLVDGNGEFEVLNDFYKLVLDTGKGSLLDTKNLLPAQNGVLVTKPELFRDMGIDESLKDISSKLGRNFRGQLIDPRVIVDIQNLLSEKDAHEVLNKAIELVREFKPNNRQYLDANVDLFSWLIQHDELKRLEGFPIQSLKEYTHITLSSATKDKPLVPKEVWDGAARNYIDLFPEEFVISSLYFEKLPSRNEWEKLQDCKLTLTEPIYSESEKLEEDDLVSLLTSGEKLDEDKDHEISSAVVTKLAFMETKDKGIIDTVRKSKEKARRFLSFLFEYMIEKDSQWRDSVDVDCVCGESHKVHLAFWLGKLRSRLWVPVRKDKSEKPSAQHLAQIVAEHPELLQFCRQDKPSRLLNTLNVSIGELMVRVVAKDDATKFELDKAMASLYNTFMANPNDLNRLAMLAESERELLVQEVEERLRVRAQVRRNQAVGAFVENLVKRALEGEAEKTGFKLEKTGVGSDFAIEYDFLENDQEIVLQIKKEDKIICVIEVKSSTQDFVKMTLTQAREASGKQDRYALCVVPLTSSETDNERVRNDARFVMDIGSRIKGKVNDVENLQVQQEQIAVTGEIEVEVAEGIVRFKINKSVWETGKTLEEFLEFLKAKRI